MAQLDKKATRDALLADVRRSSRRHAAILNMTLLHERHLIAEPLLDELRERAMKELVTQTPWDDVQITFNLVGLLLAIIDNVQQALPQSIEELEDALEIAEAEIHG